jgi:hypothetical protein
MDDCHFSYITNLQKTPYCCPLWSMMFRFMIIFSILLCPTLKLFYSKNIILCRSFLNIKNVGQVNPSLGENHFCRYLGFYYWLVSGNVLTSVGGSPFFVRIVGFGFWGRFWKPPCYHKDFFFPNSDNCPSFQN